MVHFVYILQSRADDSFYKGITDNLARRFAEHNVEAGDSKKERNCQAELVEA